jgi:hypothetical protein
MSKPKCRILCVDDHDDTSEMLQVLLSEETTKSKQLQPLNKPAE